MWRRGRRDGPRPAAAARPAADETDEALFDLAQKMRAIADAKLDDERRLVRDDEVIIGAVRAWMAARGVGMPTRRRCGAECAMAGVVRPLETPVPGALVYVCTEHFTWHRCRVGRCEPVQRIDGYICELTGIYTSIGLMQVGTRSAGIPTAAGNESREIDYGDYALDEYDVSGDADEADCEAQQRAVEEHARELEAEMAGADASDNEFEAPDAAEAEELAPPEAHAGVKTVGERSRRRPGRRTFRTQESAIAKAVRRVVRNVFLSRRFYDEAIIELTSKGVQRLTGTLNEYIGSVDASGVHTSGVPFSLTAVRNIVFSTQKHLLRPPTLPACADAWCDAFVATIERMVQFGYSHGLFRANTVNVAAGLTLFMLYALADPPFALVIAGETVWPQSPFMQRYGMTSAWQTYEKYIRAFDGKFFKETYKNGNDGINALAQYCEKNGAARELGGFIAPCPDAVVACGEYMA
jgi:hypothetical protein